MKKELLFVLFITIIFISNLTAQIKFEKGFYLNNDGERIEGLIKNEDWLNDPKKISFKATENQKEVSLDINDVSYFEVGIYKFKRFDVPYDMSYSEGSVPLSREKDPDYVEKKVYLKMLVKGNAILYKLGDQNRFYYTIGKDSIQHLLFKSYTIDGRIYTNESYKSQIFEDLKCESVSIGSIQNIKFNTKSLISFFSNYNNCNGENTYVYEKKKKSIFHLTPLIGIRSASISVRNSANSIQNVDFGNKWNPVFGLNLEYVLPFNNNKWSVFFEPVYQSYKSEVSIQTYNGAADYSSIEMHLGFKYSLYLTKSSTLYVNATIMPYEITINKSLGPLDITSVVNFSAGIGYLYNDRFSAAFRLSTPRELLSNYVFYFAKYQYFEFVLGYRIF